jgi:arabinogalactan oligomer / maltooligosaccharide transport system substrate-binding protein
MKKFKKYFSLMSGIALSLSLVACGPQDDAKGGDTKEADKPKELLVWEDVMKGEGIKDAIAKFEEENDVKVKMVEKQYTKQIEDLRLDGPAGTGPDVLTMPSDQIGTAVTEGLIKELDVDDTTQGI